MPVQEVGRGVSARALGPAIPSRVEGSGAAFAIARLAVPRKTSAAGGFVLPKINSLREVSGEPERLPYRGASGCGWVRATAIQFSNPRGPAGPHPGMKMGEPPRLT